jgi:prepilin-type N-terminal cleavage/methylation domain-containing protein
MISPSSTLISRYDTASRNAFTLIEMMVALTIALVLTAVALPKVKEGLKQNVSTRTATMVKATFENARAQAIRSGRPFGVVMHRARNDVDAGNTLNDPIVTAVHGANYCNRLSFVQMAFEYRGDIEGAGGLFSNAGTRPSLICLQSEAGLLTAIANGNILPGDRPIAPGGLVSFGEVDGAYEVAVPPGRTAAIEIYSALAGEPSDLNSDGTVNAQDAGVRVWLRDRVPMSPAQTSFTTGDVAAFKFTTVPIASPMAEVPLPGKAVIDLTCSGVGPNVAAFSPRAISNADAMAGTSAYDRPYADDSTSGNPKFAYRDVVVMFDGSGQLDSVYIDQYVANSGPDNTTESDDYVYARIAIADPVSILVADVRGLVLPESISIFPQRPAPVTTASVPATYEPASDIEPNFQNTDNAWLTISPISGRVDLSSVAGAYLGADPPPSPATPAPLLDRHPELKPTALPAPTAADYIRARLFDSRRLARGTLQ